MAKMKDVCEKTGLTEKAVRLYMKEGLIHPKTEEGVYRNAYYFSEKDIEVLKDIAVLRNAGFGISDIRRMQEQPEHLPAMIEEKQNLLAAEIYEKKALQSALERLAETERGTTKGLAEGLRPAMEHKQVKKEAGSKRSKYIMVLGMVSVFAACRYLTVNRRAKSYASERKRIRCRCCTEWCNRYCLCKSRQWYCRNEGTGSRQRMTVTYDVLE